MKRSTDRNPRRTWGSLSRPDALVSVLTRRTGGSRTTGRLTRLVERRWADAVRRRPDAPASTSSPTASKGRRAFSATSSSASPASSGQPAPPGRTAGTPRDEPRVSTGLPRVLRVVRSASRKASAGAATPAGRRRRLTGPITITGATRGPCAADHRDTEGRAAGPSSRKRSSCRPSPPRTSSPRWRNASIGRGGVRAGGWPTRSTRNTKRSSTRASCSRSTTLGSSPIT